MPDHALKVDTHAQLRSSPIMSRMTFVARRSYVAVAFGLDRLQPRAQTAAIKIFVINWLWASPGQKTAGIGWGREDFINFV